jgi:hypothetical protein
MIVRHQVVRAHIVEQLGSLSIRSTHPLGTLLPTGAANRIAAASGKGSFRILLSCPVSCPALGVHLK